MKKRGFTLIELMITLAIFSLFVGFLYSAYFTQIRENNSFNSRIDLKYNGDKAMNLITDELRSNAYFILAIDSTGNVTRITTTDHKMLIDLTGGTDLFNLKLTPQNTLVDNSNSNPVILCKGITSIIINYNEDLIFITIYLKSKNDEYTVTSAVNIKK